MARTTGGRRAYTTDDLARLDFLRCLRDTGMPIAKLRRYAELADDPTTMRERATLLEEHFAATEEAIAALQSSQRRLLHKIDWYHGELATPSRALRGPAHRDCRFDPACSWPNLGRIAAWSKETRYDSRCVDT